MAYLAKAHSLHVKVDGDPTKALLLGRHDNPTELTITCMINDRWVLIEVPAEHVLGVLGAVRVSDEPPQPQGPDEDYRDAAGRGPFEDQQYS